MGYDISETKWKKLQQNRKDGRLCALGDRGGCSNRATWKSVEQVNGDEKKSKMTYCTRHKNMFGFAAGYEGVNFVILSMERF